MINMAASTKSHLQHILIFSALFSSTSGAPLANLEWNTTSNAIVENSTFQDEIKCYRLPYGAVGFLSHLLTYWAVFWLGFGRRPYWPWAYLSAGWTDIILSTTQVLVSIIVASITISRCRDRWQFLLIAVWKLVMSVEVGIWGIRASYKVFQTNKYQALSKIIWSLDDWTPYTLIFYAMGMVTGMVGLLAIVWEVRRDTQIIQISVAFLAVTAFIMLTCFVMMCCCCSFGSGTSFKRLLLAMSFTFILTCALYSDWILGDIAGDLVGAPSGAGSVLYWAYFAGKRLPLFMS